MERTRYNTSDIIREVAKKMDGKTQDDVREMYDLIIEQIKEFLKDEDRDGVSLHRFLNLDVTEVAERTFRNPKTGDPVVKKAHYEIKPKLNDKIRFLEF